MSADPGAVRERFIGRLRARGVPEHVIAGISMNVMDESSWNPASVGDGGNAIGLVQWNGPRKRALESYAKEQGRAWQDPEVQADFLLHEGQTSERSGWERTMAAETPGAAGAAFVNFYERPAEQNRARREATYLGKGYAEPTMVGLTAPNRIPPAAFGPGISADDMAKAAADEARKRRAFLGNAMYELGQQIGTMT